MLPIRHVLAAILATIPFLAAHAAWRELHDHLMALPNLERAHPFLNEPPAACRRALGLAETAAVMAPSAPKAP